MCWAYGAAGARRGGGSNPDPRPTTLILTPTVTLTLVLAPSLPFPLPPFPLPLHPPPSPSSLTRHAVTVLESRARFSRLNVIRVMLISSSTVRSASTARTDCNIENAKRLRAKRRVGDSSLALANENSKENLSGEAFEKGD